MNIKVEKELEEFLEEGIDNDKLNKWGLILENYLIEDDEVQIESHLIRTDKTEKLIKEYFELLIRVDDDLLDLFDNEITDQTVEKLNNDFLEEYFGDILQEAESMTKALWNYYSIDLGTEDNTEITFIYNFNLADKIMVKEDVVDFYNTVLSE